MDRRDFVARVSAGLGLAMLPLASGARTETAAAQEATDPIVAAVGEPTLVKLYFVRNGTLAVVHRVIPMPEGKRIARATLQALVDGPVEAENAFGVTSALPYGANVVNASLDDESATLTATLTHEFNTRAWGGGAALRYAQVVFAMTQFPSIVNVRVAAERLLDGSEDEDAETVSGLGIAYDREAVDGALAGVFFDRPAIGDAIAGDAIPLVGYSNVYEGIFLARLLDCSGKELTRQYVSGGWGAHHVRFEDVVRFDPAAATTDLLILSVGAVSGAGDDRPMPDIVNVPLWLQR